MVNNWHLPPELIPNTLKNNKKIDKSYTYIIRVCTFTKNSSNLIFDHSQKKNVSIVTRITGGQKKYCYVALCQYLMSVAISRSNAMLRNLTKRAQNLLHNNSGATAIEYGLIAAGIAIAIVAVVGLLGDQLAALFTQVANALSG